MKYLFILLICAFSFNGFAQISTTNVAPVAEQINNIPYDSMVNDLGENLYQYVGQEFYLNEFPEDFRQYGYRDFLIDYTKSAYDNSNIYKSTNSMNSKYENMAGLYFKVIDIIKSNKPKSALGFTEHFFKLQEKKSNDIVYYKYLVRQGKPIEPDLWKSKGDAIPSFPFIVTGYFEKQKTICVGKEYVFSDKILENENDFKTGKQLTIKTGDKWKCTDLTIDSKYFLLSIIAENSLGEKILMPYSNIKGKWSKGRSYTISEVENYSTRFGNNNFEKILKGEVVIGMTNEMCLLSWGNPEKINETITTNSKSEQWVYGKNYLYFDNGILTAIQ
jgi:hypothetical protein